ncbi:hypothetical protein VNO77_34205 [Canavalia gladiata]|uniref:Uncharacterized protein n=1 Tax=Canavalia gladiata TaxID=3824 RepID=A0AAN9KH55_CANGL
MAGGEKRPQRLSNLFPKKERDPGSSNQRERGKKSRRAGRGGSRRSHFVHLGRINNKTGRRVQSLVEFKAFSLASAHAKGDHSPIPQTIPWAKTSLHASALKYTGSAHPKGKLKAKDPSYWEVKLGTLYWREDMDHYVHLMLLLLLCQKKNPTRRSREAACVEPSSCSSEPLGTPREISPWPAYCFKGSVRIATLSMTYFLEQFVRFDNNS